MKIIKLCVVKGKMDKGTAWFLAAFIFCSMILGIGYFILYEDFYQSEFEICLDECDYVLDEQESELTCVKYCMDTFAECENSNWESVE